MTATPHVPAHSHAPVVGRDVHARLAGTRPETDSDMPAFWGDDGFGFDDVIDMLNPLQHIPIVNWIYRAITGDEIATGPRILGGALFGGGPLGAGIAVATGAVNAELEHRTGKDTGEHVLSWLGIESEEPATTVAAAAPEPAPQFPPRPTIVAEVEGLPWLDQAAAAPRPAAAAAAPLPAAAAVVPGAAPALSGDQWQVLMNTLTDAPPGPVAQPLPAPQQAPRHAPAPAPRPALRSDVHQQPADVAAAMMRALEKYETLAHERRE
jgi:hypothetical protein